MYRRNLALYPEPAVIAEAFCSEVGSGSGLVDGSQPPTYCIEAEKLQGIRIIFEFAVSRWINLQLCPGYQVIGQLAGAS